MLASLFSVIGGVIFNFKTTGIIVFNNHNNRLLLKFISVYCITYLLNVGCLRIFSAYEANMYIAGAILVFPIALVTFFLLKKFVFGTDIDETNLTSTPLPLKIMSENK